MPAHITSLATFRVVIDGPAADAALAADVLGQAAGLDKGEATARLLAAAPGDLATDLTRESAMRLAQLMRLFGLRVRVADAKAGAARALRLDLALQRVPGRGGDALSARLAPRLHWPAAAVARAIDSAEGLVLRDLDAAALDLCRRALEGLPGLRLVTSDPAAAVYDMFPTGGPVDPVQAALLPKALRRLGLAPCGQTGAIAAGLDHTMRTLVERRFPRAGVQALNRDFQRFDLVLTGSAGLSAADVDGFLRTRAAVGGSQAGHPPRIEQSLARTDALAFQADYAAIGLETRLQPVGVPVARSA